MLDSAQRVNSFKETLKLEIEIKMDVLYNFAELNLCSYAFIKYVFKRTYNLQNFGVIGILFELLCIITAPILSVLDLLLILPFATVRTLINVYLKLIHGEKYGGLLEQMDYLWTADTNEAKHIVNAVFFGESRKSPEEVVIYIKELLKKSLDIRLNSTVHTILRYTYRLRSDENVDEMVRLISLTSEEASNKSKFEEKMSHLANQSLPAGSAFEILVSPKTITFNNSNSETNVGKLVVIVRLHHSLGDALSLMPYMLKLNNSEINIEQVLSKLSKKNFESNESRKGVFQETKQFFTLLNKITQRIKDISLYRVNFLEPGDQNMLHGPTLTGQKILVFETDRDSIYVPRIKSIRRKLKDCKFSDVLCTVISASLYEHFQKHGQHIPKNINMSFVIPIPRRSRNSNQPVKFSFSSAAIEIPIDIDGCKSAEENLISRLEAVKARREMFQKCIDPLFYYVIGRGISFLPIWLLNPLIKMSVNNTVSLSNIPGFQCVEFDGWKIENIVVCIPHIGNMGVAVTVHTYNDCLQIALLVDKVLVPNSEEARLILKNLYKYIDLLEREVDFKK